MASLFDELNEKVKREPRLTKRNMPRADLGLLLFNAKDELRALWQASADEVARATTEGRAPDAALAAAVDKLRPVFGER